MKLTALTDATAYRMHVPRWAVAPTSGAGAGKHGGRANRQGVDALYLAMETATAIHEYQQVSTLLPPGTLTSYQLSVDPVVDFTLGYNASEWEPIWEDFYCDWRELWFNQRIEPPSWIIGDLVIASGAKGILFPSRLAKGGTNLVVFSQMLSSSDKLEVFDPGKALPQTQASWSKREYVVGHDKLLEQGLERAKQTLDPAVLPRGVFLVVGDAGCESTIGAWLM